MYFGALSLALAVISAVLVFHRLVVVLELLIRMIKVFDYLWHFHLGFYALGILIT